MQSSLTAPQTTSSTLITQLNQYLSKTVSIKTEHYILLFYYYILLGGLNKLATESIGFDNQIIDNQKHATKQLNAAFTTATFLILVLK